MSRMQVLFFKSLTGEASAYLAPWMHINILLDYGPAKLRDSIRFRIVRPIRDSIRIDGPIRNFRIVPAVNRHS